jgi:hypothetical protein
MSLFDEVWNLFLLAASISGSFPFPFNLLSIQPKAAYAAFSSSGLSGQPSRTFAGIPRPSWSALIILRDNIRIFIFFTYNSSHTYTRKGRSVKELAKKGVNYE